MNKADAMYRVLLLLIVTAVLVIAFVFYRSHSTDHFVNVTPDAAREIKKAKSR